MTEYWRRCSACKQEIPFEGRYYVCSVSSCNSKRTGLFFCSVECWDTHLPTARHRSDAGAIEEKAPSALEAVRDNAENKRVLESSSCQDGNREAKGPAMEKHNPKTLSTDILVVASKVKKYIKDKSGMNTSASTMEALTRVIIAVCDQGIENADKAERKTVLDRDIPGVQF